MFYFGALSSFLPYILLALVYIIGMGFYSFKGHENDIDINTKKDTFCLSTNKDSNSAYDECTDDYNYSGINTNCKEDNKPIEFCIILPFTPPPCILNSFEKLYTSRPPPVIS